jgi:cyclohexadieny/prephenate dehydrogenase
MVSNSDLIIISTPLSSYGEVISKIKYSLKSGAILTDVGSVKESVMNLVEKSLPENVSWIPSHPIAGTEESGPESGFSELFKNRWCILTPSTKAEKKNINLLKSFWEKVGSKVDIMDAKQHDYILSITSHIPHLIAYNIVNTTLDVQNEKKSSIVKYSAGGLRDFTRIAASNPVMWRDIFIQNKKNTLKIANIFIKNLEDLKKIIEREDGKKLEEIFTKTKEIRKTIIEAGQDVEKPDFGRKK